MKTTITVQDLKTLLAEGKPISLIDVRRKQDYAAEPLVLPGALWRDPEQVDEWSRGLSKSRDVIIYCVKGGSVSKSISQLLLDKRLNTCYLEGGLAAWKESGGRTIEG